MYGDVWCRDGEGEGIYNIKRYERKPVMVGDGERDEGGLHVRIERIRVTLTYSLNLYWPLHSPTSLLSTV